MKAFDHLRLSKAIASVFLLLLSSLYSTGLYGQCAIERIDTYGTSSIPACPAGTAEIRIEFVDDDECDLYVNTPSWLTLTPKPGYGWQRIAVAAQPNPSSSTRSVTLSLLTASTGTQIGQVEITQLGSTLTSGSISAAVATVEYNTSPGPLSSTSASNGGTGTRTYQWESSPNGSTWTAISGATSAAYTPGNLTQTTSFRRKVSDGCSAVRYTNVITINVTITYPPYTTYSNENYIASYFPREAIDELSEISAPEHLRAQVAYYDGLGRLKQTVLVRNSPTKKDVVQPVKYDAYGREAVKYLPYRVSSGTAGFYRTGDVAAQASFYNSPPAGVASSAYPHAQTVFEPSPLNRVQQQGAAGNYWQPVSGSISGSGHTVKTDYLTNNTTAFSNLAATRRVALYGVSLAADGAPTLTLSGVYAADQLYVTLTKDENWQSSDGRAGTVEEYTDKQGRVVLKRVFNGTAESLEMLSTYYVYNDLGDLAYVLPPGRGTEFNPDRSTVPTAAMLNNFCYQYRYDERHRVIERKLPGKEREYIVYNKQNLPVLTQDGVQGAKASKEWTYTKYDKLGRVVMRGRYLSNSSRSSLQTTVNASLQWEDRSATTTGYANTAFPSGNGAEVYEILYYDNYTLPSGCPTGWKTPGAGYLGIPQGLSTATRTKVLGGTNLWSVSYYDAKGRLGRTRSQHHLSGTDETVLTYNFANEVTQTVRTHVKGSSTTKITERSTYDHAGRLKDSYHQIGTDPADEVLLSFLSYNELGQLTGKDLGGTSTSGVPAAITRGTGYSTPFVFTSGQSHEDLATGSITLTPGFHAQSGSTYSARIAGALQHIAYEYNIRGWLRAIDADKLKMDLDYVDGVSSGVTKQYNGNIAEMSWEGEYAGPDTYQLSYDKINRLRRAENADGSMDELLTYDKMGNILTLTRGGYGSLSYDYQGTNQLKSISGFRSSTYLYDANGNLADDSGKGITNIAYNYLNLPQTLTRSAGNITYTWDGTGRKLKTVSSQGTIDYISGIHYLNGTLDFIQTSEGRVRKSGSSYVYEYYLKDHLGNVRVTITGESGEANVVQEDEYYAFGLRKLAKVASPENKYLYNGKELQEWEVYDYGARMYDPVIGRWGVVDALAEVYYNYSPYNYTLGNPIILTDPDGNCPTCPPGMGAPSGYLLDKEQAEALLTMVASVSDLNDATVLVTTFTRDGKAIDVEGNVATTGDKIWAAIGLGLPAVSGSAVKKAFKAVGKLFGYGDEVAAAENTVKSVRKSNKLGPVKNEQGTIDADHSTFARDQEGNIYKYETYEKTKTGHPNPVKRFDGGTAEGKPGIPHKNKNGQEVNTPHVQGKTIPEGARKPNTDEYPKNKRFDEYY